MSRAVFLSAQPCFHGLHRPHADDLRALIRRCVSFVFTPLLLPKPLRDAVTPQPVNQNTSCVSQRNKVGILIKLASFTVLG